MSAAIDQKGSCSVHTPATTMRPLGRGGHDAGIEQPGLADALDGHVVGARIGVDGRRQSVRRPEGRRTGPPGLVRITMVIRPAPRNRAQVALVNPDRARSDNQDGITGGDADRLDGMQPHGVGLNEGGVQGIDGVGHGKG